MGEGITTEHTERTEEEGAAGALELLEGGTARPAGMSVEGLARTRARVDAWRARMLAVADGEETRVPAGWNAWDWVGLVIVHGAMRGEEMESRWVRELSREDLERAKQNNRLAGEILYRHGCALAYETVNCCTPDMDVVMREWERAMLLKPMDTEED